MQSAGQAAEQGVTVSFAGDVLEYFVRRTVEHDDGARPLRHMLESEVEDPLATRIIEGDGDEAAAYEVTLQDGDIKIVEMDGVATVDDPAAAAPG